MNTEAAKHSCGAYSQVSVWEGLLMDDGLQDEGSVHALSEFYRTKQHQKLLLSAAQRDVPEDGSETPTPKLSLMGSSFTGIGKSRPRPMSSVRILDQTPL